MADTYDQREVLASQRINTQSSTRTERVLQAAIRRAEQGHYVLMIVEDRPTVMDVTCYVPLWLTRYLTIRCMDSHKDIDWCNWKVPGWEDHELFVDPTVLSRKFPNISRMFNF